MSLLGLEEMVQDALGWQYWPKVTDTLVKRITWLVNKKLNVGNGLEILESFPPHVLLNVLLGFDATLFDNFPSYVKVSDIPVQAKQAVDAGVPAWFLGTIGVLKENGEVAVNSRIIAWVQALGAMDSQKIRKWMDYNPWTGIPKFLEAVANLIRVEEQRYKWGSPKGFTTTPVFIPWGTPWIALLAHKFLSQWDLVMVPNTRWPNVDAIFREATKTPPLTVQLIDEKGEISLTHLSHILSHFENQKREEITLYLNFPNNPTWVRFSKDQWEELNQLLRGFSHFKKIRIIIDDPYGSFSIDSSSTQAQEKTLYTPLSYMIDTRNSNIELFELGAHGTKEAGIYGMRLAVLRAIVGNSERQNELEKEIASRLRSFLSMSPSIPQQIYLSAIQDVEAYMTEREKLIDLVFPNIHIFRDAIVRNCWEYLIPIKNNGDTGGFFLAFRSRNNNLDFEELRNKCLSLWSEGVAFIVLPDYSDGSQIMRITLISWDYEEFAYRLRRGIDEVLS